MSSSTPAPSEVDGGSENIVFIIETSVAAFTVDVQDKFRKALTQIYEVELLGVTILSIETYDEARRRLLQLYIDRIKVTVLIKYDRIPSLRNPIAIDALSTKMAEDGLPSAIVASVTVIPIKNNISTPAPKDDVERPFWAYFLREWGWFFLAGVLAVILVFAPILVLIFCCCWIRDRKQFPSGESNQKGIIASTVTGGSYQPCPICIGCSDVNCAHTLSHFHRDPRMLHTRV